MELSGQLQRALIPALTGYNFQQTALVGMLPLLALQLGLGTAQTGLAVSAGLIVAAIMAPLLVGWMTPGRLRGALLLMLLASLTLMGLMLLPQPVIMGFVILLMVRAVQGTAAAIVMAVAQGASAGQQRPVTMLARAQIGPGLGRAAGAALIGPLAHLSLALPILPGLIGAAISLRQARGATLPIEEQTMRAPLSSALILPFLVQSAVGAGQLGLAPLLAQTRSAEQAVMIAGLCLAGGYLALLLVHSWLTAAGDAILPGATLLVVALAMPVLSAAPLVLVAATALAAGAAGLLIARHLARVIAAHPGQARRNAAWQGSALLAGLGSGAGAASLLLPLSPVAPFLLGSALALSTLPICQRFP